ncbi:hypothetical protein [Reyranella sp.]|uniref:hypothetical protein n=1 Tax=Reyranella sp. TaxID=1929291 RepID=UPI003D0EB1EB
MTFSFEVVRPEDLLRLEMEARNLRIDRSPGRSPELVVENASQPAFLIVHFQPQAIAEGGYYEATILKSDVPDDAEPQPPPITIGAVDPPGQTPVRIGGSSRLVFKVPPQARIPFTIEGVLDWSGLGLSVNAIAAIGPVPTSAEIAAAPPIARPRDTETAIELPYRLIVSPTAEVSWGHRRTAFTSRGRTELWHTRLQLLGAAEADAPADLSAQRPASLRAIWSPDFGIRKTDDPELPRAAMAPDDRHQIVVKTSAFHGYENEVSVGLSIGFGGLGTVASILDRPGIELKFWVPFVPQPFYAEQLMLSSLGGWLNSRGAWAVVRKAKPSPFLQDFAVRDLLGRVGEGGRLAREARAPATGRDAIASAFTPLSPIAIGLAGGQRDEDGLDLSEWVHHATQGRDHYVKVVYEGELLPFHHRAALVKVTERKFKENGGLIVANLFQRFFLVVREPEKRFDAGDRGMPFKRVEITTLVTPDIADPSYVVTDSRSFWVEVMRSPVPTDRVRLRFPVIATDPQGEVHNLSIPMLFLSQKAQGGMRQAVLDVYNDSTTSKKLADRSALVPGQKIAFTERGASTADNMRLATRTLTFALAGEAPQLLKAEIDVPQVQQLLGKDAPTTIRLYPGYVSSGFDAGAGVFAEVVKETPAAKPFEAVSPATMDVTFSSDQAGGFATPNLGVTSLSRDRGPLAGNIADALIDKFDPTSFFPAGTASLFGTFDLVKLLVDATLGQGAPKLETRFDQAANKLVATLDWTPEVRDVDLVIAAFKRGDTTKLDVHGLIEKPVDQPAVAPTSHFWGKLTDFSVTVLKSVEIKVAEFGFDSQSGRKPDVTVKLDPANPLAFTGQLKFVEELRKVIPPDLFGKGPSLDLSPAGIRAGFSFALPPVAVGVFALKDVSLGAGLSLPFLDGRPTLDFNVSERPHPFLLSVGIFGGGGFFHLQLDTAGIKVVEAALEFGVTASIDLGVASGGVHIMAGIYFKLERQEPGSDLAPTLSGYLRMGGELSVIGLIKVSLEFVLSFTYDGGRDKAYGRATLTVKVEIAFFSTSVDITVERAFGGKSGDPSFGQLFSSADTWSEYAEAFA